MIEILGKNYYIDVENIAEKCATYVPVKLDGEESDDDAKATIEVNIFKYEIIKMCLDRLLNDFDDADEEMNLLGVGSVNISLKIAFNTLIKYNILIEDDE
jgi:hypothetical protein